jgi:hypothetical protein
MRNSSSSSFSRHLGSRGETVRCCLGPAGATGGVGPVGPSSGVSTIFPFSSGPWAVSSNTYLSAALTDPSGTSNVNIGQTSAAIPPDNSQDTIDSWRNAYATVAPRNGTLSGLNLRVLGVLAGADPLSDNVTMTFQILTAPTSFASNDFTASTITATVTFPAGSVGGSYFFSASDLVHSVAVTAGQRFLIQMVVATNPNGNAADLFSALSIAGGILFT